MLVGAIVMTPEQTVAVTRTDVYPTYQGESEGLAGGVDMAFLTLATPLTVTPVPVRTDTTDAELTGAEVTVVGYGVSDGTDNSGAGFRLEVVLQVGELCSRLFHAGGVDANVCVGDSGGAVLHRRKARGDRLRRPARVLHVLHLHPHRRPCRLDPRGPRRSALGALRALRRARSLVHCCHRDGQ